VDTHKVSTALDRLFHNRGQVSANDLAVEVDISHHDARAELEKRRLSGDLQWGSRWSFLKSQDMRTYKRRT